MALNDPKSWHGALHDTYRDQIDDWNARLLSLKGKTDSKSVNEQVKLQMCIHEFERGRAQACKHVLYQFDDPDYKKWGDNGHTTNTAVHPNGHISSGRDNAIAGARGGADSDNVPHPHPRGTDTLAPSPVRPAYSAPAPPGEPRDDGPHSPNTRRLLSKPVQTQNTVSQPPKQPHPKQAAGPNTVLHVIPMHKYEEQEYAELGDATDVSTGEMEFAQMSASEQMSAAVAIQEGMKMAAEALAKAKNKTEEEEALVHKEDDASKWTIEATQQRVKAVFRQMDIDDRERQAVCEQQGNTSNGCIKLNQTMHAHRAEIKKLNAKAKADSPLYNTCKAFMREMMARRSAGPFDYTTWIVELMGGWNRPKIATLPEILAIINPNSEGVEGGKDGPNQIPGITPTKVFPNIRAEYEKAGGEGVTTQPPAPAIAPPPPLSP